MRTKRAFVWTRTCSCLPPEFTKVIIPSGAPVQYNEDNKAYYIEPGFFKNDAIVLHDATYYGCRVDPDNVEEVHNEV